MDVEEEALLDYLIPSSPTSHSLENDQDLHCPYPTLVALGGLGASWRLAVSQASSGEA
jgi:hypothetical protein